MNCYKSIICNEVIKSHKSIICNVSQIYYFFVTMYFTCEPSVQFCTFPHSVYKGTKTTDFFVTVVSQCNDESDKY